MAVPTIARIRGFVAGLALPAPQGHHWRTFGIRLKAPAGSATHTADRLRNRRQGHRNAQGILYQHTAALRPPASINAQEKTQCLFPADRS
jgi:hypothetical protein